MGGGWGGDWEETGRRLGGDWEETGRRLGGDWEERAVGRVNDRRSETGARGGAFAAAEASPISPLPFPIEVSHSRRERGGAEKGAEAVVGECRRLSSTGCKSMLGLNVD